LSQYLWMRTRRISIVSAKYFFAVVLSLSLAFWLRVPDYLSAAFISVLTLQPNLYRGLVFSWQQIKGTVIGVGVTVGVITVSGGVLFSVPYFMAQSAVAMAITIGLCLYLELDDGTVIAIFTVAYLTCLPRMIPGSFFDTLHLRCITIAIGLTVGCFMNYGSSLFGYHDRLYQNIVDSVRDLDQLLTDFNQNLKKESGELTRDRIRQTLYELRQCRKRIGRIENDLKEIQFQPEPVDSEPVEEGPYRKQFELIYFLKDFSHHFWSLLLFLMKSPSEIESVSEVCAEFDRISNEFSEIRSGMIDYSNWNRNPDRLRSKIRQRVEQLRKTQEDEAADSDVTMKSHLITLYKTIEEGYECLETDSHETIKDAGNGDTQLKGE